MSRYFSMKSNIVKNLDSQLIKRAQLLTSAVSNKSFDSRHLLNEGQDKALYENLSAEQLYQLSTDKEKLLIFLKENSFKKFSDWYILILLTGIQQKPDAEQSHLDLMLINTIVLMDYSMKGKDLVRLLHELRSNTYIK